MCVRRTPLRWALDQFSPFFSLLPTVFVLIHLLSIHFVFHFLRQKSWITNTISALHYTCFGLWIPEKKEEFKRVLFNCRCLLSVCIVLNRNKFVYFLRGLALQQSTVRSVPSGFSLLSFACYFWCLKSTLQATPGFQLVRVIAAVGVASGWVSLLAVVIAVNNKKRTIQRVWIVGQWKKKTNILNIRTEAIKIIIWM